MIDIQVFYLLIVFSIGILATLSFWGIKKVRFNYNLRIKKNRYDKLIDFVKKRVEEKETGVLFKKSGFRITAFSYQMIRYVVIIIWFIMLPILHHFNGSDVPVTEISIIVIIFAITSPTPYLFGKRTPFKLTIDFFKQSFKNKKNIEVYRAISQLKNIAITKKTSPMGSDFIIEQLRNFSHSIRDIFNKMLGLWTMGRKEEACNYFETAVDTKEAKDLANIFRKLDELSPHELLNQIMLLQETIRKERETRKMKSNENKGNLVYVLVIITSSVIMINFIVVVYFLDTMQQLKFIQ